MKIKCYRTSEYKNTNTFITDSIWGTLEPDEMTDEDRQAFRSGAEAMCCFTTEDGKMHCVPWQFVISIEGGKQDV